MSGQMIFKEKDITGKISISSGKFYYDTKIKKLIYSLIFPNKVTWISKDTNLYKLENGKVVQKKTSYAVPEFSIFSFTLNGNLQDYGMKKSGFKITNVEKLNEKVYITYSPQNLKSGLGKVVISQKKNLLDGVVFYNPKGKLISKQFYKKYIIEKGISFPTEIISITYVNNAELYTITNYDKIVINDFKDDKNYDIPLSVH